ncbi:CoA transferase subunit A [Gordonia rhizosphera]|uniref:Putative CoA-transferase alpha subunit n=1 Tax=Gordonia rhizosphera NBRC 16068 TaxID=1108045 RepID=K6WF50_9ACTN|nr:CoA-transferase [Gordonia rhizosphera]GAB92366.1 putative CoA-transferase alpha subunit [Gordonia rhizosphera NBRC 16068]
MTEKTMTDLETAPRRNGRVTDAVTVGTHIADGMTVAIGGFINSGHPMSLVRQLILDGRRGLRVVGAASAGLEIDLLIAAGCVDTVVTPYVGAEGLTGIGAAFRKSVQDGTVRVFELDEAHFYAGLRASAQRLPFNPWRAGVGTSYPVINPALKEFRDPINGELLLAIPAIEIDVCLLHASISDEYGNVQHNGTRYGDIAMYAASEKTFVSVERVVSPEEIRANPLATSIPGATGIVRTPFGAHPYSADGHYAPDVTHIQQYIAAATTWLKHDDRTDVDRYIDDHILSVPTHAEYLARIGTERLLSLNEY